MNVMFGGDSRTLGDDEDINLCQGCGLITITLPVGLQHEEICIECAEKDEFITITRMKECFVIMDSDQ